MSNYDAITGCQLLSNSGGEGDNGDSDFFLVELNLNLTLIHIFLVGIDQCTCYKWC